MTLPDSLRTVHARWAGLPARERHLVQFAAALVLVALAWQLLLAPALATLRGAEAQARALDAQLQQMRVMQQQARSLQSQPVITQDAARQALDHATRQALGAGARLAPAGDRVNVTLSNVPADALAQWLALARLNARSVPLEARLSRTGSGGTASWTGVVVMSLPAP